MLSVHVVPGRIRRLYPFRIEDPERAIRENARAGPYCTHTMSPMASIPKTVCAASTGSSTQPLDWGKP